MPKIILFLLLFIPLVSFGSNITLAGRVQVANSGELISGAHIYCKRLNTGTISNSYGFFSIELHLTETPIEIKCSMIGYETKSVLLNVKKDTTILISLSPTVTNLNEVVVESKQKVNIGYHHLLNNHIALIPTVGGEPDLLKGIQSYPGVVNANDGVNNLSVRGSNHWQNLILLDEAIVYNPNHALSFFSVFNNDAVKEVEFYKAYMPVNYGGRNASVIDVRMKEGNNQHYQMKGGVGLVASRLSIEGPIIKEKLSFILSGRYGNPGGILNLLDKAGLFNYKQVDFSNSKIDYYDVNAKVNLTTNSRNRFYLSFYTSSDHFNAAAVVSDYAMHWKNATGTFRWSSIVKEKMNLNTTLSYSNYNYDYEHYSDGKDYLWSSDIRMFNLKENMEWYFSQRLSFKLGVEGSLFYTLPGEVSKMNDNSNIIPFSMGERKCFETVLYTGVNYSISEKTTLEGGIRLPILFSNKNKMMSQAIFIIPEPRLQLIQKLSGTANVLISANVASQNMHLMTNSSIGLPSDIWLPANKLLRPMITYQFSSAYKQSFFKQKFALEIATYYKNTQHIADFKDNANLFMNDGIENELLSGWSNAYGVEMLFDFKTATTHATLSYTYSFSRNHIDGINNGKSYRPVYDRPHSLKLFLAQQLDSKWSLSSTFALRSGMNLTLPINSYIYQGVVFYEYSERNGYRAPLFHQLDLMINYKPINNYRLKSEWSFGIMNLYDRKNVFSMFAGYDKDGMNKGHFCKMYLYGILPSVTYNFKF